MSMNCLDGSPLIEDDFEDQEVDDNPPKYEPDFLREAWALWSLLPQTGGHPEDTKKDGAETQAHDNQQRACRTVFRMPLPPPFFPPCLQCSVAGSPCSLTMKHYAKRFVNDRRHNIAPTAQLQYDVGVSYDELVRTLKGSCVDFNSFLKHLAWTKGEMQQEFLSRAIARGATDSPFLDEPPNQCDQCARDGDKGCLQQTMDLAKDMVEWTVGMPDERPEMEVAWFATSGPPSLSLLPQHSSSVADQIRHGHYCAGMESVARYKEQNPRVAYIHFEAVFCRDPFVMTASQVLQKTNELFQQLEKQRQTKGHPAQHKIRGPYPYKSRVKLALRPAKRSEISRMLPRGTHFNVYADTGITTAYRTSKVPLPAWDASAMMSMELDESAGLGEIKELSEYDLHRLSVVEDMETS